MASKRQVAAWIAGVVLLWPGLCEAAPQPGADDPKPPPRAPAKVKKRTTPPPRAVRPAVRPRPPRPAVAPARPRATPTPKAQPPKPVAPKPTGLALKLSVGTSAQIYASVTTTAAYPGVNGRFLFGWRIRRVTLGLGLEFVRTESVDSDGHERSAHVVLFRPTVEVALWQPHPLSLYLSLGVHGGFLGTAGRNVVDDELPAVGFHSGIGVRYFLHPRFALGMEGGFQGVWLVDDDGDDTVDGTVLFYGAFSLLAIL